MGSRLASSGARGGPPPSVAPAWPALLALALLVLAPGGCTAPSPALQASGPNPPMPRLPVAGEEEAGRPARGLLLVSFQEAPPAGDEENDEGASDGQDAGDDEPSEGDDEGDSDEAEAEAEEDEGLPDDFVGPLPPWWLDGSLVLAPEEEEPDIIVVPDDAELIDDFDLPTTSDTTEDEPKRVTLRERMGLPSWLDLGFSQRTRYEWLNEEFRAGEKSERNTQWAIRNLMRVTARQGQWRFTGELQDSRVRGVPSDGFVNTGMSNAAEPIQAFIAHSSESVILDGDVLDVRLGRQTMNIGSRRLVARNNFRNTMNAFTGGRALWQSDDDHQVQAFLVTPQRRRPSDRDDLVDNEVELDDENWDMRFLGVFGRMPLSERTSGEVYAYRVREKNVLDEIGQEVKGDRKLWTIGARTLTPARAGETSFEWESAFQFGDSRADDLASGDETHRAHFHHVSLGYQFEDQHSTHVEALFDYASGDEDPNDSENNRFDTLFGARRWEYGPTGIFGVLARSNLISPGARLSTRTRTDTRVILVARSAYLAQKKDAWTASGLRDPSGDSGRHIGELADLRVIHEVVPDVWRVEFGVSRFWAGSFVDRAPNNTGQGDANYLYMSTQFRC